MNEINWGGINTGDLNEMYEEALEFFRADIKRHHSAGRHIYSKELAYHLDVIEERVRRSTNTVKALMPTTSKGNVGRRGRGIIIDGVAYKSRHVAAITLGKSKSDIIQMLIRGEAQQV